MARRAVALAPGVWRIPTVVGDLLNVYALVDGQAVTLVDVGLRRWSRHVLAGLEAIGFGAADVRRVVLTHAHADHAGGLDRILAEGEAGGGAPEVAVHERDAIYLRDGRAPRSARFGRMKLPQVVPAEQFFDGTLLPVAGGLRVVHTPGHTPGHTSLLHEPTGVLLTGDALFNIRSISYAPGWVCTDPELSRKSADVLGDLDYDLVAFAHGSEIRAGAREAVRAFLRGRAR